MVEEDLWDLGDKWKTLLVTSPTSERPDTNALDGNTPKANLPTDTPIIERLASDKSVASFGGAFGRDQDSDDEEDVKKAAADAAFAVTNPPDLIGTKFVFSPEQVERDHARAEAGLDPDLRSMSTAGKTTESTRLHLKEAREELADLKIELQAQKDRNQAKKAPKGLTNKAISKLLFPTGPDNMEIEEETEPTDTTMEEERGDVEAMDSEEPTDAHLLGSAVYGKHQQVIHQDSDAMEDQEHQDIYIGTKEYPPSLPSSESESHSAADPSSSSTSSSSTSSSSTDSSSNGSHDTAELMAKLSNNQYQSLSKSLTKNDKPSISHMDNASFQSSGQSLGSSTGHSPDDSSGKAGVTYDDASQGD